MTGEITLRGQVLAIGGVKEKVLAAHRNGLTTVILPKRNEQDIDDVPDEIRNTMKFIFAESVDDVINAALEKAKPSEKTSERIRLRKNPSKRRQRRMSKPKILLAEDDVTMVSLLKTLLKMEGFEVVALQADADVPAAVRSEKPDVILLDVHLGPQSGLDILDNICNSPGYKRHACGNVFRLEC